MIPTKRRSLECAAHLTACRGGSDARVGGLRLHARWALLAMAGGDLAAVEARHALLDGSDAVLLERAARKVGRCGAKAGLRRGGGGEGGADDGGDAAVGCQQLLGIATTVKGVRARLARLLRAADGRRRSASAASTFGTGHPPLLGLPSAKSKEGPFAVSREPQTTRRVMRSSDNIRSRPWHS